MAHRQDLNALAPGDRQDLVELMLAYIDDDVVDDHMLIVHSGVELFTGHRAYIGAMEDWLQLNGGAAFTPLPSWNPANPIPPEFDVVKADDDGNPRPPLTNLNPNMPKPAAFESPAVCSYEDPAELGNAVNGWHGSVHCAIGGTMCDVMIASAAPIFWCWHAYLDHIYWDWQQCSVECPNTVGSTLGWARQQLRLAGLTVGTVTRLPRLIVPPERIPVPVPVPLPDPPPFVPQHHVAHRAMANVPVGVGGGGSAGHAGHDHDHGPTGNGSHGGDGPDLDETFRDNLRAWRSHMRPTVDLFRGPRVLEQYPAPGTAVRRGRSVDLTVV